MKADEPRRYTFEEIMGAMTSQEAIDAAEVIHNDRRIKAKPTYIYLKEMLEAATEGAFGG